MLVYQKDLQHQFNEFERGKVLTTPFKFYQQLQLDHERHVNKLGERVQNAAKLAQQVMSSP